MSTNQPTNPHRGSDFNEFMIDEGLMPTPRTDAIAHAGHNESVYIARMTYLARQLERELEEWKDKLDGSEITHEATRADLRDCKRELEQERQDRKQADLDTIRALGERNDARRELAEANRKLAALPRSGLAFGSLLARYGIVQSAALDDPEGYDGHATLDALYAAFEELTGVVANEAVDPP